LAIEDAPQAKEKAAVQKLLDLEAPLRDARAAVRLLEYVHLDDFNAVDGDAILGFLRKEARRNLDQAVAVLDADGGA